MANSLSCVVDMTSSAPTVTHLIPVRAPVTGVTSLGNYVFVVRHGSQQVSVYDSVTFTLQRRLAVTGLGLHSYGLGQHVPATSVSMRLTTTTTSYTEWSCQAAMQ